MAIKLVTGGNGNFKTCWLLEDLGKRAKAEGRRVLYSGIPLTDKGKELLGWEPLGNLADQVAPCQDEQGRSMWRFTLPEGAIVVIDEAQAMFRVRSQGAAVPPVVQAFETHRHHGLDFVLVTQHPQLIDINVRKLVVEHVHTRRVFGMERSTLFRWEECRDPTSETDRRAAALSKYVPNRDVYTWYRSASMHTVKKRLPWKYIAIGAGGVVVVIVSALYTLNHVRHIGEDVAPAARGTVSDSAAVPGAPLRMVGNPWSAQLRAARDVRVPASAPIYDSLQRVVSQPRVAGCMSLRYEDHEECSCTDDQGSRLHVDVHQCRVWMREGWFDETRRASSAKADNIAMLNARDRVGAVAGQTRDLEVAGR